MAGTGTEPVGDLLLERERELQLVADALAAAEAGKGTLTVIEGPPGVGKSVLLEHATADAASGRGMEVLKARGGDNEQGFPFGVALQLFEALLAQAAPDEREELLTGAAALCSPLFTDPGSGQALAGDHETLFSLVHGLYWLASNLADRRPLVLAIDDVHWADESSLRFLLYLVQRIQELPMAVILALRPVEPGGESPMSSLRAHADARVIRLDALSGPGVAALLRLTSFPDADEEFCAACFEATGGNPFLVRELAATLAQEGVPPNAEGAAQVRGLAPEAVSRSVLLRLSRLGEQALGLCRAVAVLGSGAALALAAALAGLDPDDALNAAASLTAVAMFASGQQLAFLHPVLRSAVYSDIPGPERARLHERAARLLYEEGVPPDRVAHHLLSAPRLGEPWVVDLLRSAAGQAIERGAPQMAVAYLRRVLEEQPPAEIRAATLLELGEAAVAAGEPDATDLLGQAAAAGGDERARARAFLALSRALYARGDYRGAADAARRGGDQLDGSHLDLATELDVAYISVARFDQSLADEAQRRIRAIVERPPSEDSPAARVLLAEIAAHRAFAADPREECVALACRAWADGLLLREQTVDGPAVYVLTGALVLAEEFELDEQILGMAIDEARSRGSVMAFATGSFCRSWPRWAMGKITDAIADAEQALDMRRYGWEQYSLGAQGYLALALMERGDFAGAERAVRVEDEAAWVTTLPFTTILFARGRLRLLQGRYEAALEDLLRCGELVVGSYAATNPSLYAWRSDAAQAALRLGRREQAAELAAEEVSIARGFGAPRALGVALRAAGIVEGGDAGLELLEAAVATLRDSASQLELARALAELGSAQRRARRRADARDPLREALDIADRIGAAAIADRAREELALSGARPRRAALTGTAALTPGELRVARLAAEGLTNREIAESLFVTRNTVDWHLRHVYQKLDVKREELADVLRSEPSRSPAPR